MLSASSRAFVSDDLLEKMIEANISLSGFSDSSTDMIDPRIYESYSMFWFNAFSSVKCYARIAVGLWTDFEVRALTYFPNST